MNNRHPLNYIVIFALASTLSACNLNASPGTQPTGALPTATLPPSAAATKVPATQVSSRPTETTKPTEPLVITAEGSGAFGPITAPNYTPPPTFTQAPFFTPSAIAATPDGPTAVFGAVVGPAGEKPPTSAPQAATSQPTQASSSAALPTMPTVPTIPPIVPTTDPNVTPAFGAMVGPNYTPPPTLTPVVGAAPVEPGNVTLPPAFTPGPSPTPGPILRRDLMGIQVHAFLTTADWDRMLDHVRNLGLGWVKVQVQWSAMEPNKGEFSEQYRTLVLHLQRAGSPKIRTLVSVAKAPNWARPASAVGQEDGPPENPQDLADFLTHLVHDTSAGNIDAIEVWNEPNLIREWHGKPLGGAEYMKLFNAAYTAIVNEQKTQPNQFRPDHRIEVLTGAPAPTSTSADGSSMDDRGWIQQLYANGLGKYGDDVGLSVHPYAWANAPDSVCCNAGPGITGWYEHPSFYMRNTLDDYRNITVRNNDSGRKLWITEFGFASYDGLRRSDGGSASVNPASAWESFLNQQQQASYVLRAFYMLQQPPYYDFLGPVMLWNLNFATLAEMTNQGREEAGFSLLDQNGNPRPVYSALQQAPKQ